MEINEILDKKIIIKDEDGNDLEGEILFSFEENGDNYVIYTIGDIAYGAKMNDQNELEPVDDDEWTLVEEIFNQYLDDEEALQNSNDEIEEKQPG